MTSKKVFVVMVVSVIFASVVLVATVVLGDQLLQKQSRKLTDLKVQNAVVDSQQTALNKAKKDIAVYTNLNDIAKQIVPQDKDQARAVREIISIANESGVNVTGVTFPASNLGQAPPPAVKSDDSDATTTPTPVVTPPPSQVKPVEGISGVYQLELTISTDATKPITYLQLVDFLGRLEQNRRTAQIINLTIQPDQLDRNLLTFGLQLTIYIKP